MFFSRLRKKQPPVDVVDAEANEDDDLLDDESASEIDALKTKQEELFCSLVSLTTTNQALASELLRAQQSVNSLAQAISGILLQQDCEKICLSAAILEAASECPCPKFTNIDGTVVIDFPADGGAA